MFLAFFDLGFVLFLDFDLDLCYFEGGTGLDLEAGLSLVVFFGFYSYDSEDSEEEFDYEEESDDEEDEICCTFLF